MLPDLASFRAPDLKSSLSVDADILGGVGGLVGKYARIKIQNNRAMPHSSRRKNVLIN